MSRAEEALSERAQRVLGSGYLARQWLNSSNPLLNGTSPAQAVSTPEGQRKVEQQLAWFAGRPAAKLEIKTTGPHDLHDLVNDPLIQLVLERAGSGPEELLRLYRQPDGNRRAA